MTVVRMIRKANQQYIVKAGGGLRAFTEAQVSQRWPGATVDWTPMGEAVKAQIIRSDWVVVCPDCRDGMVAEPYDPVFYCPNCQNARNDGKARPVIFPDNRTEIETVLLARAIPDQRNWKDETIEQLKAENREHGEADTWPT